jgi:hypothetical protein
MPRYERIWLEEPRKQYHSFPEAIRRRIDRRIKGLLKDRRCCVDAMRAWQVSLRGL